MKHALVYALALLGFGVTSELAAESVTVGAYGTFTETLNESVGDVFTITNNSDLMSGMRISSVSIHLNSNTIFDTNGSLDNPGSPFQAVTSSVGGDVVASISNGSKLLTLDFTDFNPGETFQFTMDVDRTMGPISAQRQVLSFTFAGAIFSVTFEDMLGGNTLTTQSRFDPLQVMGVTSQFTAASSVSGHMDLATLSIAEQGSLDVSTLSTPEPSSLFMFSLGAVVLAFVFLKRKNQLRNG